MKPFFSVIIPTLNEERYLPRLLVSLSLQTSRNFEVIVVDGKSEDHTRSVFLRYRSRLPKSRFFAVNRRNVAYQRNYGAHKSRGRFLVFLDADCNIPVTFLNELHKKIRFDHLVFATTWITPDSPSLRYRIMITVGNLIQELVRNTPIPFAGGYNTIIRRDVFLRLGGFREDLKINEDHDFAIKARKNGIALSVLRKPIVTYSTRRYSSEGLLRLIPKLAYGQLYMHLVGPVTGHFDYQMGGHVHKKNAV